MKLKWIEDFLNLCNSGNFRTSSEQRCVSQPAFSRRIKALETWLGVDVIDRTRYPVCLTPAGEEFKPIAEQIVRLAEQARNDISTRIRGAHHSLSIATLQTLAQFFVPSWLQKIQKDPGLGQVKIRTDFRSVEDYLNGLEEQLVDFFVCYEDLSGSNFIDKERFPSKIIGHDELILVSPPDESGNPLHSIPAGGKSCSIVQYALNSHLYRPIRNHQIRHFGNIEFVITHEASTTGVLKAMALQGFGMVWLPISVAQDNLDSGALVPVCNEYCTIPLDITAFRCKDNTEPHVERLWNMFSEAS